MDGSRRIILRRFDDAGTLRDALAERLAAAIAAPAEQPFGLMLAGGSTPLPAYRALAARGLAAAPQCRAFLSDERYVPGTADDSNWHAVRPLLDALRAAGAGAIRVRTELPLAVATAEFDAALATLVASGAVLRLGVLGLGGDGHTASLFSERDLRAAAGHFAVAVHRPDGRDGITVTPALLSRFETLLFVVEGAAKRAALAALLRGDDAEIAARAVAGCAHVEAWADAEAADGVQEGAGVTVIR